MEWTASETGMHYLHVLTVDKSNRKIETVSKPILVVQELFYQKNNDCQALTGGWEFYVNNQPQTTTVENKNYSTTYGSYEMTTENLNISLIPISYNNTGTTNEFKTKQKIDLTPLKKIGILAEMKEITDYQILGITENENYSNIRDSSYKMTIPNNSIIYLDVSHLVGEYYIQFGMGSYRNGNAQIYKIWAE